MVTISLAEASEHLTELVDNVIAGETVEITVRGEVVARLVGAQKVYEKVDVARLKASVELMPKQDTDSGTFIRAMRDDARY